MPWIKATPRMNGTFEFSMDDISRGKVYKTAEECMDSFSRFEKDASFGPLMTCRPIFFPLNDEELEAFNAAFAEAVKELYDKNKELRYQKYKRCLDKAEMCKARYDEEDAKENWCGLSWYYISDEMKYWERWRQRWLELADKFNDKEA